MLKKIFCTIFLIFIIPSAAVARTIKVMALDGFSTASPLPVYKVQTLEPEVFENGTSWDVGTVISGDVVKIEAPKRCKRNAKIEFIPTSIINDGEKRLIDNPQFKAELVGYIPLNPKEIAFSTGKKVVNFVFKGVVYGIVFVQGVAEAEDGKRVKTGLTNVYKESFLSYLDYGKDLQINPGDTLILKLKKNE